MFSNMSGETSEGQTMAKGQRTELNNNERNSGPKERKVLYEKNLTVNIKLLGDARIPTIDVINNVWRTVGVPECRTEEMRDN